MMYNASYQLTKQQKEKAMNKQFSVYKATGLHTNLAYYGYVHLEDPTEIKHAFCSQASNRQEIHRGDIRLLTANKGDINSIEITIVEQFDNELDAWTKRNDLRVDHCDSITAPTPFPTGMAERCNQEKPETVNRWRERMAMRLAKTARQAYAMGMWSKDHIQGLAKIFKRDDVIKDLDKLTPDAFDQKYSGYMI